MSKGGIRRVRRTAAQWEALLVEQVRSGLTQDAFCRMQGLGYSTFGVWRARLRRNADARVKRLSVTPHSGFIELPAWPQSAPVAIADNEPLPQVELELGNGMVLRIGRR